jgi:hypothetical protein
MRHHRRPLQSDEAVSEVLRYGQRNMPPNVFSESIQFFLRERKECLFEMWLNVAVPFGRPVGVGS